jgi:tripartite-type tricarboxylate transporter receptor subunit TctC
MRRWLFVLMVAVFMHPAFFGTEALLAADFPSKPITMIVWSTAGMADTLSRVLANNAGKELGQPMLVENKPGAHGAIGINQILRSKPDGYTLGMVVTSNLIIDPHVQDLPYDIRSATDILAVCRYNFGLAVKADAPWNTFEELLAYAKKNPGKFTYATTGVGSSQHIAMEQIAMKEGIKWTHIPFKSGGAATIACLGGSTDAVVQGSVDILPHLRAGKFKMLVSLDGSRWPDFPNVPEITEKGYNCAAISYISYIGPKGIPEGIRQKLENALKKAMQDPSFEKIIDQYKVQSAFVGGKEYSRVWRSQYDEMGRVVKALGLAEK